MPPRSGSPIGSASPAGLAASPSAALLGWPRAPHLPQWRVLDTDWAGAAHFLPTWAAWRADTAAPRLLHYVALSDPVAPGAPPCVDAQGPLAPLAVELQRACWGLLPGIHRLVFDQGRVLLTLCVGDASTFLRQQPWGFDAVRLVQTAATPGGREAALHWVKAVGRTCQPGTRLVANAPADAAGLRAALAQCGFQVEPDVGEPAQVPGGAPPLRARFDPPWRHRPGARTTTHETPPAASTCIVIGGGIAGAATAASLARRGWQVQVLDQGADVGAGASGLPAGVFAPHVSPDDNVLSRLSRAGVRAIRQQAQALLRPGLDWAPTGVLEHRVQGAAGIPRQWAGGPGHDWSLPAPEAVRHSAALAPDAVAHWHPPGGWIRPVQLVRAWLAQPGVGWTGNSTVAALRRTGDGADGTWQALDPAGRVLGEAPLVVVAAGAGSMPLMGDGWALQPVRGQVSWGLRRASTPPLVPFPVNGHGNLVPDVPLDGAWGEGTADRLWVMGSTFERDVRDLPPSGGDRLAAHRHNWSRLQGLLSGRADELDALRRAAAGDGSTLEDAAHIWAAVRCTSQDRLPLVGPLDAQALPGLWACTAMGSRGLTLSALCAELLAARLHQEPLPIDGRLARALDCSRYQPAQTRVPAGA